MNEYQDKQGEVVFAKKTVYANFLKEKGWVLPFISANGTAGYIVQHPNTKSNNKTYDNAISWFSESDFNFKYTATETEGT